MKAVLVIAAAALCAHFALGTADAGVSVVNKRAAAIEAAAQ